MPRTATAILAIALLAIGLSGCTSLRSWVAPFRGLNSDLGNYEPNVGQYSQPPLVGEPER